ncbi:MAG TPA: hypothetical protein VK802_08730, partial [Streptosporangiaceae bacterium]|nr:hypothetical protein [Streptosporangiaceae bacterium]
RHDGERHWLRAAPRLVGHLFPRLLAQSEYNTRLRVLPEPFPLVLGLRARSRTGSDSASRPSSGP